MARKKGKSKKLEYTLDFYEDVLPDIMETASVDDALNMVIELDRYFNNQEFLTAVYDWAYNLMEKENLLDEDDD